MVQLIREAKGEIPTNYTRKYADTRGWGTWEIVRELFQNALDISGPVGTVFKPDNPTIKQTPEGLIIQDRGAGFSALNLLMGTTTKKGCERGRFGEGMKIACLAALNIGYQIDIITDSMHIVPQWKTLEVEEPTGGISTAEVMVFKYEKTNSIGGTRVLITGPNIKSWGTMLDRFNLEYNKNIVIKKDIDICEDKLYASYIINEPVKSIYVRNIWVQDIGVKISNETQKIVNQALYSYDLFGVRVSTDRNIPNADDVYYHVGKLWSTVSNSSMIESFFKSVISEGYESHVSLSSSLMNKNHTENAWRSAFNKTFRNAFLRTGEQETRLAEYHSKFLKKGIYLPEGIRHALYNIGIDRDIDVLKQIKSVLPRSPLSLTDVQIDNMEYIKMIHYKMKEKYYPKAGKVFLGNKETMMDAQGKVIDNNIYLREDMVLNMVDAIDVFGHEFTHVAYPHLNDNTSDFYSYIGHVMAIITKIITQEKMRVPPKVTW